jgi:D-lyxose ketol-isomerase
MLTLAEYQAAQKRANNFLKEAGIVITPEEVSRIEVADLGLGALNEIGLELVVYVNTEYVCAKELVLFPRQICPEHRHPPIGKERGKEETFRCRWGTVYLHVPGKATVTPKAIVPASRRQYFTVWHEVVLKPGDQYTLAPNTLHWFQGGDKGAVVSEFSTRSRDETDVFTDPEIKRQTKIEQ